MLITEPEYSIQVFLDIFTHKFSNFCSKSPTLLTFQTNMSGVLVKEQGTGKFLDYKFDHSIGVKQNIKIIKDWLVENTYPVLIQEKKEYSDYSNEEIEELIDTGISPEQAVLMRKEKISLIKWKITRILIKKDELFLVNMENNKQFRFKMKCPCTIFLRNLREKWTPTVGWHFFEKNSYVLNEIIDVPESEEDR